MYGNLTVIIPALDEAEAVEGVLRSLQPFRAAGAELILVDGGSRDGTRERARPLVDGLLDTAPGRAVQMNAGAKAAAGELLWFLHADTTVDAGALDDLRHAHADPTFSWGRFGVRLSSRRPLLRVVAGLMNLRSCVTGIATGDQGLCVRRRLFAEVGGFPEIPLMEDIALSRLLRAHARPRCLPVRLTTSSRRWENGGAWRTIGLMWSLRWAYWRGADPAELARRYRS